MILRQSTIFRSFSSKFYRDSEVNMPAAYSNPLKYYALPSIKNY